MLRQGNSAQLWLRQYNEGWSVEQVMQQAIVDLEVQEEEFEDKICQGLVA
ncbi:MAG: hypothetical protein HC825_06865 [Oscillatoriales cyanobacterium RM1_1_9]|nr:hypothetical protein [Oscillatoriales cyanobacterium RM1_1_9]